MTSLKWAYLAMMGQTILAGLSFSFARNASVEFDPYVLLLLRTSGAALFFVIYLFFTTTKKPFSLPKGKEWLKLMGLSFVGVAFNQFMFLLGLKYTTPANSAILYTLTPLFVLIIAVFFLKDDRLNVQKVVGVIVAILGVLIVLFAQGYSFDSTLMKGNLITLGAVLSWAMYLGFGRLVIPKYDSVQITAIVMILGALMYAPIGLWHLPGFEWQQISERAWIGYIYITFFSSALAYLLLTMALQHLNSSQASVFINAQPIVAALFSWLAYGEELTLSLIFGGIMTIAGIVILQKTNY